MQMLANLSGSHPLLQEEPQQALEASSRNIPRRSISFKDPTPDKSRMEALSKLGLTRNRAMSGGTSLLVSPNSSSLDALPGAETSAKLLEANIPPSVEPSTKLPEADTSASYLIQNTVDRKSEVLRTDSLRSLKETSPSSPSPPPVPQTSYSPPPLERNTSVSSPPEVTSLELNRYGGKSVVIMPTASSRNKSPTSPTSSTAYEAKPLPPVLANPSELNTYGGKTKVVTPPPVAVKNSDLPDILSSHIDKSQNLPAKPEPHHTEFSIYGGKTRTINPSSLNQTAKTPAKTPKAPPPTLAPRPPRHSYHGPLTTQKVGQRALSPEHKRRPASMFRPQGITVHFAGREGSEESRREALRKLGLLKDS